MKHIYEVMVVDELASENDRRWTDSYWDTREEAIVEAERLWNNNESYELRVIRRTMNIPGVGFNYWNDPYDMEVMFFYTNGEYEEWNEYGELIHPRS